VPSEGLTINAIGLTKDGHNSMITGAVDKRGRILALYFFPGQCAETKSAKQLLPLLVKTKVFVGARASTPMNSDTWSRTTAALLDYRLVPIKPATDSAIQSFIAINTWLITFFSVSSIGAAWRAATRNSLKPSSLSQHSVLNRLHPTRINPLAQIRSMDNPRKVSNH
jgi:hypothetical protein